MGVFSDWFSGTSNVAIDTQAALALENIQTLANKGYLPKTQIQAATVVAMGSLAAHYGSSQSRAK